MTKDVHTPPATQDSIASPSKRRLLRTFALAGAAVGMGSSLAGCAASAAVAGRKSSSAPAADMPATIAEAGKALRAGVYSAEELTRQYLAAITEREPTLNAFITVTADAALAQARVLDQELRAGKDRGPLHGIPIVHKDLYDTRGVPTTVGAAFFRDRIPEADATVVRKLAEAGAITLGKTNMNEFAAGITGTNEIYGDTRNPWDPSRSPGGSSSGTGAAVAAGLALGGTGSDTGGSIRVPASWDGLTGIRPTYGRVSLTGVFPRCYSLDCAGPIARSAEDAALMLSAMAGYDATYRYSVKAGQEDFARTLNDGVRGLRLGIIEQYTFRDVDADVGKAVEQAIRDLEKQGAKIVPVKIPLLAQPVDFSALFTMLLYEFNQILGDRFRAEPNKNLFGKIVQDDIAKGERITRAEYEASLSARNSLLAQFKRAFTEVDTLVVPSMPNTAPALAKGGAEYNRGRQFLLPISWTGMPSLSTPVGLDSRGLPIGLQLVGNSMQEAMLLRTAHAHQRATGWHLKRPAALG